MTSPAPSQPPVTLSATPGSPPTQTAMSPSVVSPVKPEGSQVQSPSVSVGTSPSVTATPVKPAVTLKDVTPPGRLLQTMILSNWLRG